MKNRLLLNELQFYDVMQIEKSISFEKARRCFLDFVLLMNPEKHIGWFHKEIIESLQIFYEDFEANKQPRLMVFAPPQHGKSTIFSRFFPAWIFGKNQNLHIIMCSYSQKLASRMNQDVQKIMSTDLYKSIFPDLFQNNSLSPFRRRNSAGFDVKNGAGIYLCSGIGGSITGMRADFVIIDDPIKNFQESISCKTRQNIFDWYTSTLYTRLSPKGSIVLGMTRWHEDDLAGRLIKINQKKNENTHTDYWKILSFSAIATQDEKHRKKGEALHPERYNLKTLQKNCATMGFMQWESLYQQNPQFSYHALIKIAWFKRWTLLPELEERIMVADTAFKTGRLHDYSVVQLWGKCKQGYIYLIDQIRGKWESIDLENNVVNFFNKHCAIIENEGNSLKNEKHIPPIRALYIEDKASGISLIQNLKRRTRMPIRAIKRTKDKITRLYDVQGYLENSFIRIPEESSFTEDFLLECQRFSFLAQHEHDDQVDCMIDAVHILFIDKKVSIFDI